MAMIKLLVFTLHVSLFFQYEYRLKNYNYNEGFGIEYRQSKSYKYGAFFFRKMYFKTTKLKQIIFAGITFNKYYNNNIAKSVNDIGVRVKPITNYLQLV